MNANDSMTLWSSYKTTEERAGPLPTTSTPLKTPRSYRGLEDINVTTIAVNTEQDRNRNLCTPKENCRQCWELTLEVQELKRHIEKQAQYIQFLKKSQISSEMDSSESPHGNSSSVSGSCHKNTKVQRVTPTKRETSSSSQSTSSSNSTPVASQILQQTPRAARTTPRRRDRSSIRTPTLTTERNVTQMSNRTSSSRNSAITPVTPTQSNRQSCLPPSLRIPQSEPLGIRSQHAHFEPRTLPNPRPTVTTNARRSQSRRRLFASEPRVEPTRPSLRPPQSDHAIEHLNISPVKDVNWAQACPPRLYLERNRPEFIERVKARQSIIKAASEKRAEIEQRKRLAARAVALGRRSRESVRRDLDADSTAVKAFYEQDMREMTLKNIRKSQSYQNQMWQRMATVDRQANRIIAQSHSLRARSTSRSRYQY
uniref:Coiled-coil domain-containing protein n=1 Tax=Caenorhabditis tropicalis TaxID=1561998 RepID=A0A1I7V3L1_9PELO